MFSLACSGVEVVRPRVLVCLGATAAQTLLGKDFRVTKMRGQWVASELADKVMATIHPSAILRTPDRDQRELQYRSFVADLMVVAADLRKQRSAHAK